MDLKKGLKSPSVYAVTAALVVTAFVGFYMRAGSGDSEWMWSSGLSAITKSLRGPPEPTDLAGLLRNAAMDDGTVVVTYVNEAWASPGAIMDLMLRSFRTGEGTERYLKHLLIVSLDRKALDRCRSLHPHCYLLTVEDDDLSREEVFMTPGYLRLVWKKVDLLLSVVELGHNLLFTDGDIVWLRDPFPRLPADADIAVSCDSFNGNPTDPNNPANTGFMHVRSNNKTIQFFRLWSEAKTRFAGQHDQTAFDVLKHEQPPKLGLNMVFMDTVVFSGICRRSDDLNRVCTMHANCCGGLENKLHDLTVMLNEFGNFTKMPPEVKEKGDVHWGPDRRC